MGSTSSPSCSWPDWCVLPPNVVRSLCGALQRDYARLGIPGWSRWTTPTRSGMSASALEGCRSDLSDHLYTGLPADVDGETRAQGIFLDANTV